MTNGKVTFLMCSLSLSLAKVKIRISNEIENNDISHSCHGLIPRLYKHDYPDQSLISVFRAES